MLLSDLYSEVCGMQSAFGAAIHLSMGKPFYRLRSLIASMHPTNSHTTTIEAGGM